MLNDRLVIEAIAEHCRLDRATVTFAADGSINYCGNPHGEYTEIDAQALAGSIVPCIRRITVFDVSGTYVGSIAVMPNWVSIFTPTDDHSTLEYISKLSANECISQVLLYLLGQKAPSTKEIQDALSQHTNEITIGEIGFNLSEGLFSELDLH